MGSCWSRWTVSSASEMGYWPAVFPSGHGLAGQPLVETFDASVALPFAVSTPAAYAAVLAAASSVVREEIVVQHDFFSVATGVSPRTPRTTSAAKRSALMRNIGFFQLKFFRR